MDQVKESNIFRTATGEKETGLDADEMNFQLMLSLSKFFFQIKAF